MRDNVIIIQRDTYSILDCWIVFSLIAFIGWVILKASAPNLPVLGISVIANLLLMLSVLSKYRLKSIKVDISTKKVHLIKDKWFFVRNELEMPLQYLSLKETDVNRGFGIKVKVFSIFSRTEKVAEAITGVTGWKEDDLKKVQQIVDTYNS